MRPEHEVRAGGPGHISCDPASLPLTGFHQAVFGEAIDLGNDSVALHVDQLDGFGVEGGGQPDSLQTVFDISLGFIAVETW